MAHGVRVTLCEEVERELLHRVLADAKDAVPKEEGEVRYLSLCSGIEAASRAWHSMGWEPVAFSEIEITGRIQCQRVKRRSVR